MKKKFFLDALCILALMAPTVSCSEDEPEYNEPDTETPGTNGPDLDEPPGGTDEDQSGYDHLAVINTADAAIDYVDDVWADNNKPGFLVIDGYDFSHFYEDYKVYDYVYGFTASKITDTSVHDPLYTFPYASVTGGGVGGAGTPYLVGYWDIFNETDDFYGRTCRIFAADGVTFVPQSVMVTNNTYAYYTMLNGSPLTQPFKYGDYLKLTAHGVHPDGSEQTADFYLANIINPDDVASGILKEWARFDLSGLGICTGIYFTMSSSDSSEYGMNTPSYFCLDQLIVKD